MNNSMIDVRNVTYKYPDAEKPAVDRVSLRVSSGEFIAVLGRNGSGKSTLAKLLNALLLPTEGEVIIDGRSAKTEEEGYQVRERCGMVFQNPDNQIVATIVEEDCAFGPENLGIAPKEIRARVDEALKWVGMEQYAKSSPNMLSGGQKQRVAIAGVLAMRPKVIVFDESTAMLDPVGRAEILALAKKLNREEGITVMWITHFMNEAAVCDRVLVMDAGKIALQGTPREVFSHVAQIRAFGLEVPEMMRLADELHKAGLSGIGTEIMTIEEMTEALCRLKCRD